MSTLLRQQIQRGASQLGIELSAAQLDALYAYLELLIKWNKVYNLTAIRDENQAHHRRTTARSLRPSFD